MRKVVFSLLLVFSVAAMTSCQKIETNTESSTKNKILGTWEIVSLKSGNSQYIRLQKGYLLSFWDMPFYEGCNLTVYGNDNSYEGWYTVSDNRLMFFDAACHYELEIEKLNDTKMSLSGKYWYEDYKVGSYCPIEIELERVVK